jgi:hypothetical protein
MKKQRIIKTIIYGLLFLLIVIGLYFLYTKKIIVIPCLFHEVTSLYCPGCGMSRALISLVQLNIYQAIRYNALVIVLVPVFIIYLILKIESYINNRPMRFKVPNYIIIIALIVVVLYGVLRNIPLFDFLKPTVVL